MSEKARGMGRTVSATFTRPSDTNTYAAGDVICNSTSAPVIMKFEGVSLDDAGITIIQDAICVSSANVATKPDLELWLFDTAVTMDNDNAAFTPTDAEMLTCVGVIKFPYLNWLVGTATAGADGNALCHTSNQSVPVSAAQNITVLYGVLVVRNAYIPVSGEVFTIRLKLLH